MRVKYVKDGVSGKLGDIRTHERAHAYVLIKLGICVPYEPEQLPDNPAPAPAPKKRGRPPKKGEAFGNTSGKPTNDETTQKPTE